MFSLLLLRGEERAEDGDGGHHHRNATFDYLPEDAPDDIGDARAVVNVA